MGKCQLKYAIQILGFLAVATFALSYSRTLNADDQNVAPLLVKQGQFVLDGKPLRILSGEMHYPRIPRQYWRERFRAAKAMGLNTLTTYVFWNIHETSPGVFDFSDNNDVAEYIREAQQEGLYVILRPGPYVCAEWELGGFPAWLLKNRELVLRANNPQYLAAVHRWFLKLGEQLAPLQYKQGGPIIAIQVENEYGAFGDDPSYVEAIHQELLSSGFDQSFFYTADNPDRFAQGSLPELPIGMNFGAGDATDAFKELAAIRPGNPFFVSEYWTGWFDYWGGKHHTTDIRTQAQELQWMLEQGASVSLYMFHGGTNFGWMNGADHDPTDSQVQYLPYVTSYDYDAPLSESGRITDKYRAFRQTIALATGATLPEIPQDPPSMVVPEFGASSQVSFWKALPNLARAQKTSLDPLTMEDLDQAYGFILYRKTIQGPNSGALVLDGINDYAKVYLDGVEVGDVDRRVNQNQINLTVGNGSHQLDILVENSGRINYSSAIRDERKGIRGQVSWAGALLQNWKNYSLPMDQVSELRANRTSCTGPCFAHAHFLLSSSEKLHDTFLDMGQLGKGFVWLNGKPLGRFWNIGPQRTLYVPSSWLRHGQNEITVFDLEAQASWKIQGLADPILQASESSSLRPRKFTRH